MNKEEIKNLIAVLRQARDEGTSVDAVLEIAFGEEGYPKLPAEEHELTVALYRKAIGDDQKLSNMRAWGYSK